VSCFLVRAFYLSAQEPVARDGSAEGCVNRRSELTFFAIVGLGRPAAHASQQDYVDVRINADLTQAKAAILMHRGIHLAAFGPV
jgi:hypothetical protein